MVSGLGQQESDSNRMNQLSADKHRCNEASKGFWRGLSLPDGTIDRHLALVTLASLLGTLSIKLHVPAEVMTQQMLRMLKERD